MTEQMRMFTEIGFNICYLIFIWTLVIIMARNFAVVTPGKMREAKLYVYGFFLLAFGDTGHVGFRVWAYSLGSLESRIHLGSLSIPLVGAGALATAITVAILYLLMLEAWRIRNRTNQNQVYWILMVIGAARFIIMLFPQNNWRSIVPPLGWSLARNIPLIIVGLGLAVLYLQKAARNSDQFQKKMGIWILVSYGFYLPVILFVQAVPLIGMLMIPKTIAYLFMALNVRKEFFKGGD
ncbi:MAG: hypothetical protein H8D65_01540 [Spirochaetes bacterium]|nr:hypothetical protein [Spirochaetota bacterium]